MSMIHPPTTTTTTTSSSSPPPIQSVCGSPRHGPWLCIIVNLVHHHLLPSLAATKHHLNLTSLSFLHSLQLLVLFQGLRLYFSPNPPPLPPPPFPLPHSTVSSSIHPPLRPCYLLLSRFHYYLILPRHYFLYGT